MIKFLVGFYTLFTAIYFIVVCILAFFYGVNWFCDAYICFAELIVCIVMSSQGKYHCRNIKYLGWGVFASDTLTRVDAATGILTTPQACLIPIGFLCGASLLTLVSAILHFVKVQKVLNERKDR